MSSSTEAAPTGLRSYRGGRRRGARNKPPPGTDEVKMLRVPAVARRYSVSETKVKTWIKDGKVRSVLIGHIRLVEAASVDRLLGL
jgi:hypothetical protein